MPNYIRVKQINQGELTGFFVDSISSQSGLLLGFASGAAYGVASGIILNETVLLTGNQNVSGNKTFLNNLNVSGDVTIAGTLRYNEIIDTTVTGSISGYTGIFQQVYANNLVYNTGNQTIAGIKTFLDKISLSGGGYISGYGITGGPGYEGGLLITSPSIGGSTELDIIQGQGSIKLRNDYFIDITHNSDINLTTSKSSINLRDLEGDIYLNGITTAKTGTFERLFASNLVYNTGNQTISGIKTFDLQPILSGNPLITGNLSLYATITNLASTGSTLDSKINNFSGYVNSSNSNIVFTTGDQTISGTKTFSTGVVLAYAQVNTPTTLAQAKGIQWLGLGGANYDQTVYAAYDGFQKIGINFNREGTTNLQDTIIFRPLKIEAFRPIEVSGTVIANNLVYNTGNQTVSGVKTFINSGIFSLSGAVPLNVPNNPLSVVGSGNTYVQVNIQNRATGATATSDLVITANNGTDSSNYINLGINNSGYNDPTFSNGSGLDGYLFINGGSLDIGTQTPNTNIEFHAGGTTANKVIARISESGFNLVSGNLTVNNTGVLLSGSTPFVLSFGHIRNNSLAGSQRYYFGSQMDIDPVTLGSNEKRRVQILQDCYLRKIVWTSIAKTNIGTPTDAMTGFFKNFGNNPAGTDNTAGNQVTTAINIAATNQFYNNSTGDLNIPIKSGDYVSFYYNTNFNAGSNNLASGLAVNVNAYFYV